MAVKGSRIGEAMREVTIERLQAVRRPVEVEISPQGTQVAFTVSPVAKERGGVFSAGLWLLRDLDSELIAIGEAGSSHALPRFSADGAQLAYSSDADHRGRMSLQLDGRGELGSIKGSVEDIRWSPDSRSLLVLAADVGSDRAGVQTATRIREDDADEDDPKVYRPAQYWRRLFLVDAESGKTRQITPEGVNVFEFDWAGGKIAAVCTDDPSESAWYEAWLGLIDVDSRAVERVHVPSWQLQCPRISSEGQVAWIEGIASDRVAVTGTVHVLGNGPLAPELDVTWIGFAGDEELWYAGRRRSGSMFGRVGLDGAVEELLGGDLLIGNRRQPRVSPSVDGTRVAFVLETVREPPEIVLLENRSMRALTSLNDDLASRLPSAEWRRFTWESIDGLEIEGLLVLPVNRGTGPLPLVAYVHGGPTSSWVWGALSYPVYLQPLLIAQEGYAVFLPNPRGSAGRGQEFARANLGDMGGADLQDILTGIDALVRGGIADNDRVAITGGSYGGFMSCWAVTQTNRFAAAIPYAVGTNWFSKYLTTNIRRFTSLFMDDDPYDPSGEFSKRSPVYHARQCTTPTLILHGEDDLCTPVSQAFEFYNALVEAGCETELVAYPREGHGWLEREHQVDAWQRVRDWLARHLG
jgi:dipeptidyl aminopeptidase/acylaminoacyl peptidase